MIVRLLREQRLADPLPVIPAGTLGEVYAFREAPVAPLIRWYGPYPFANVNWEDLQPLDHLPWRVALRQLRPDPVVVVSGLRQSFAWAVKFLLPAAAATAVNVGIGHLLGK
jgi:hypothetical protein